MAPESKPVSISLTELSNRIPEAVKAVKANAKFAALKPDAHFFPDPGVIGFILNEEEIKGLDLSEGRQVARHIVGGIGYPYDPAFVFWGKYIVCGFFPYRRFQDPPR